MSDMDKIACNRLRARVMSAEHAASLIPSGSTVGMSGFTGSGYPKAVPLALAARIEAAQAAGRAVPPARLDRRLHRPRTRRRAGQGRRASSSACPIIPIPIVREKINRGEMEYFDMHLSQVAPMAWQGFLGPLDIAVIEVSRHPRRTAR